MEMQWDQYKKRLLAKPGFRKALQETALEYQIARELIKARLEKGFTQKDVARRMKTTQSVISRVENAQTTPSLSFLKRVADVLDAQLHVRFS